MKKSFDHLDKFRVCKGPLATAAGDCFGAFEIPFQGRILVIIASNGLNSYGYDWEHASVSLANRCPNWPEMCFVKGLFWGEEETVIQFHPPKSEYINNHEFCLHLWKKVGSEFELPPGILVGIKEKA